jgi:lysophospholipase L1-like esterase
LHSHRNGLHYLPVALETHYPLDLLIIMLGTNDLKATFNLSAGEIARGASRLLEAASSFRPEIGHLLLVSPAHVTKTEDVEISAQFPNGVEKSSCLAAEYQRFAERHGSHFFDAASVAHASSVDGIHLDAENHKRLADGLAQKISSIFRD